MDLSPLRDLADRWREEAERYERDGALVRAGALLCRMTSELTEALDRWWLEELTLEQAAEERGQSYDTIQRRVATGRLHNVGRKHRPRVRRADLYRKDSMAEGHDRIRDVMAEMLER
jgi:hypothetical protein